MLRLALSRVNFHSTHPRYPFHRLFSNCPISLMELESTGTHRDPVTGEMISKQYVYIPPNVVPLPIDPPCAGNLSVAKSNVKKRQGRRRIPQIGLRPRAKRTPQRKLQTRKTFRLMYAGRIDICAITWRLSMGECFLLTLNSNKHRFLSNILNFVLGKSRDFERHSPRTPTLTSLKFLALSLHTSPSMGPKESSNQERRSVMSLKHLPVAYTAFGARVKS